MPVFREMAKIKIVSTAEIFITSFWRIGQLSAIKALMYRLLVTSVNRELTDYFFDCFDNRPSPIEQSELKWQAGVGD